MAKRYSVKTDNQSRSYICDQKTINELPLKTGALTDTQVVHRLNRLECMGKTINELGQKLDRRNKQIDALRESHDKLKNLIREFVHAPQYLHVPNWVVIKSEQALSEAEKL